MKNLSIKTICIVLIIAIALSITGCVSVEPNVTGLTGSSAATNPGGDTGGAELDATQPADPGSDGPSKPVDPTTPSEPAPSVPVDPSTPSGTDDPAHEHEYVAVVTKATCLEVGFTTYTCDCGDTYVGDRIEATGHQWSDWVVTKEPTVDNTGEAVSICAMCENTQSKVLGKVIPNHTHNYSEKVTKKATCSAEGVMTLTCSCGDQFTRAIAKTAHKYKKTYKIANCYEEGYTTYTCENCGYSYKGDYKKKTTHDYAREYAKATCEEQGFTLYMCGYCLDWYEADLTPALGHDYIETVVAPTCTEQGYTLYECSRCDKSYKDNYIAPIGHDYHDAGTLGPSMDVGGFTIYACSNCGHCYRDNFTPAIPQEEYERMVAEAVVKYINQFRKEQGETEAISLPGLTLVAEYRAVQLETKFEHSTSASREAFAHYQYGEYHDMTKYGYDESYNYWSANAKEAIAAQGLSGGPPDEVGESLARQFLGSKNHWAYVGSSEFSYIGVGISYNKDAASGYNLHCCVLQTSKNYG